MTRQPGSGAGELRIGYVFSQFPIPTQTFAISDIDALRELGHHVTVFTLKMPPSRKSALGGSAQVPADLSISRPSLGKAARWPGLLWRRRREVLTLWRLCRRGMSESPTAAIGALLCIPRALEIVEESLSARFDVVHLFWSRHAGLVLHTLHELAAPPLRSTFVGAYDLVADDFLVAAAMDSAETIFTHSESNRPFVETRTPRDVQPKVVHRGIPIQADEENTDRDRNAWITVSALQPEKNVHFVIEAFARAKRTWPELRLSICGDGPERARLEALAARLGCAASVRFLGHVERKQVFALLREASVFLLMSTKPSERLPNVVKEAMWSGCRVIVSTTEGIEELVSSEEVGSIVRPSDQDAVDAAIAVAMEETVAQADFRRAKARTIIETKFSSISSMQRYATEWRHGLLRRAGQLSSESAKY